jgi:chromosome segregation ATPase
VVEEEQVMPDVTAALADANAAGMLLVKENERLRADLARVTTARDDALDAWEDLIEKYERQAEEIAALEEVVKAARLAVETLSDPVERMRRFRDLRNALARLDAAPAEARE